jgi:hypothetical protein
MRIKSFNMVILILSAVLTAGCGVTTTVSVTDVTQPVMLGKIKRLHGTDDAQWQLRAPFTISISHSSRGSSFDPSLHVGSKVTYELLKMIEISEDKIVIDEFYIGSFNLLVAGPRSSGMEERSWADIKGGIYRAKAGEHETK